MPLIFTIIVIIPTTFIILIIFIVAFAILLTSVTALTFSLVRAIIIAINAIVVTVGFEGQFFKVVEVV